MNNLRLIAIAFFIAIFSTNAFATDYNYTVNNLKVEATENDATTARNVAITKGQIIAFSILLNRMDIDQNYVKDISSEEVSQMIQSMQIHNEKMTLDHYSASLDITFSKEFVKYILNKYSITNTSQRKEKFLVFPAMEKDGYTILWKENNIWMAGWRNAVNKNKIKQFVLPDGDLDDIAMITSEEIKSGKYNDFTSVVDKYKADSVVVTVSDYDEETGILRINIDILKAGKSESVSLEVSDTENESMQTIMETSAIKVMRYIVGEDTDIIQNKSPVEEEGKLTANVPISNLSNWVQIRKRLEHLDFISNLKVKSLSKNNVLIAFEYDADYNQLVDLLNKNNFSILTKNSDDMSNPQYYLYFNSNDWQKR